MSELLNSLNQPSGEQPKSFAQEVAEAAADYKEPEAAPEPRELRLDPVEPEAETEPVAEAAPEPVQQPAEQRPAPQEDDRKVSLKALQEERQKRQEMERELAQMRAWLQQQQQPQEEQFQEPDPETDPIGALKYTKQQLAELRNNEVYKQQETYYRQTYARDAQSFAAETPDFGPAYQYAINSRAQELEAIGMPREQIASTVQAEEMQLVANALRNGVRPSEAIYKFAKARGYRGEEPAPAAPAAAPAPQPDLQKARQAVSPTPAAASSKPGTNAPMSLEVLANSRGAVFDKGWEKIFYPKTESSMFRR